MDSFSILLSQSEALVLYDWISSLDEGSALSCDDAVQKVIWKIEGILESNLNEVVLDDYSDLVAAAKRNVLS